MNQIQKKHFATLLKYLGISFITGGLSHGFFTGERQIITAIIGIVLFSIGTLLLNEKQETHYTETIIYSAIFAIALGSFTGGLQHFPDSPERSMIIVPIGFILSIFSFYALERQKFFQKQEILYTIIGSVIVLVCSLGLYSVVEKGYFGEHAHAQNNGSIKNPLLENSIEPHEHDASLEKQGEAHDH